MNDSIQLAIRNISDVCAGRDCLEGCIERLRAADRLRTCAPRSRRGFSLRVIVAVAVFALVSLLFAFRAFSDVKCIWSPEAGTYQCFGVGDQVIILPGESSDLIVITNSYGCCTNCTAIDPTTLSNLLIVARGYAQDVNDQAGELFGDLAYMRDQVDNKLDEIEGYQNSGYLESNTDVSGKWASVSNYLITVDNDQTRVVRSGSGFPNGGNTYKARLLCANDAIYLYANNSEVPQLNDTKRSIDDYVQPRVYEIGNASQFAIDSIDDILPQLAAAPDCGKSNSCEGVTGRWCTEEQGDAIIKLLQEQLDYLLSVSNYLHSVDRHLGGLYQTFMNLRGGIPSEAELDNTWQNIYLNNTTSSFDYGYTNVMERIELLLYGLSGVGSNDTSFTSAGLNGTDSNELFRTSSDVSNHFSRLETSFDQVETDSTTLYRSLERFFEALGSFTARDIQPQESVIGSFSIDFGDGHLDVPSLTPSDPSPLNDIASFCHTCAGVLWFLLAGFCGIRFYQKFLVYVMHFCKWAWEVLEGLFSR